MSKTPRPKREFSDEFKADAVRRVSMWFATWWLRVPEPRLINLIVGAFTVGG